MSVEFLSMIVPMLLEGLQVTMKIAIIGILLGFVLGALSGYALQSKNIVAKGIANVYIWIIRGTPLVVQALYVYFAIPALITLIQGERFTIDSELAGIICITLNTVGLQFVDNSKASIIASIEPVTATLLGMILYGEDMTISGLVGMVFVLIGLFICR
jgi:His/Glu/Gln/Arg/opine family amino acid ABC transporter permease subunit